MSTNWSDVSSPKDILIFLLWLFCGVFSWYVAAFLFTPMMSPFLARWVTIPGGLPGSRLVLAIADVLVFNIGEYITAFFAAAILCYLTGYRGLCLVGFIVGANGYPLYSETALFFVSWDSSPELPSWVIRWWIQAMAPTLIVGPFAAWVGCVVGRRLRGRQSAS